MKYLFILVYDKVYIVQVPAHLDSNESYDYARTQLGVKDETITPWQEANFVNGIAVFRYSFQDSLESYHLAQQGE